MHVSVTNPPSPPSGGPPKLLTSRAPGAVAVHPSALTGPSSYVYKQVSSTTGSPTPPNGHRRHTSVTSHAWSPQSFRLIAPFPIHISLWNVFLVRAVHSLAFFLSFPPLLFDFRPQQSLAVQYLFAWCGALDSRAVTEEFPASLHHCCAALHSRHKQQSILTS